MQIIFLFTCQTFILEYRGVWHVKLLSLIIVLLFAAFLSNAEKKILYVRKLYKCFFSPICPV